MSYWSQEQEKNILRPMNLQGPLSTYIFSIKKNLKLNIKMCKSS